MELSDPVKRVLRVVLDLWVWLIGLRFVERKNFLPPVRDPLLLLSAVELADQIRTGKVSLDQRLKNPIVRY